MNLKPTPFGHGTHLTKSKPILPRAKFGPIILFNTFPSVTFAYRNFDADVMLESGLSNADVNLL